MIDIDRVRADTPACASLLHFDNAGASLMPEPVFQAVNEHLSAERDLGGYEAARRARAGLDAFYIEFAGLLNAALDEIAYAENATRAWDMAVYALPLEAGDRIVTHASEYASNYLAFLKLAKRRGIEIDVAPSDGTGQVDVAALERLIGPRTKVIALTHVPTQGGVVNPAEVVGEVARQHGLIYVPDACQSVGQIDVDVGQIGCHVLTGTGRKFLRGQRGTGFLYTRRDLAERVDPPFVDLRAAIWTGDDAYDLAPGARRFENFESNVAGRIGLARAVRYARDIGLPAIERRVADLAATLRQALSEVPGVAVHDLGARKCGIVTFTKAGTDPCQVQTTLAARGLPPGKWSSLK
jgi:selenocysteine lyase/cysteine desulfurase